MDVSGITSEALDALSHPSGAWSVEDCGFCPGEHEVRGELGQSRSVV